MRIAVEIMFDPEMSPVAFVTCTARDGRAGAPFRRHYRVLATGALEELEEVLSLFLHLVVGRAQAHQPLPLWEEN
jgi:hypothetical protein